MPRQYGNLFNDFMEKIRMGIIGRNYPHILIFKTTLMISRKFFNRAIIILFFVLTGYCLANSLAVRSIIGTVLAAISMGAGITFLYLLAKQQQETDTEESF